MLRRFAVVLVVVALVAATSGFASATTSELINESAHRMFALGLVKGADAAGTDLALDANMTRAQLVTILVRAFGQDANARNLNGAAAFTDSVNHPWASGYIAMAKRIIAERTNGKEVIGLPDGSFNPDGNVTAAQSVAFIMKFLGVPADQTKSWPNNYIDGALTAGIITDQDRAVLDGVKNTPATRGLAFYLMDRAFYNYRLAEGGTVYTKFVDTTLPTITLDTAPSQVEADSVTLTGAVSEAGSLVANGANVPLNADHRFAYKVTLAEGMNTVTFIATDIAGNKSLPLITTMTRKGSLVITDPLPGLTQPATMPGGPASTYTPPGN